MSCKAANPNYVAFGRIGTVVTLAEDRGQLRTNDTGGFFLRNFIVDGSGKFTCAGPELERKLVDLSSVALMVVGTTRIQQGRSVVWSVRRLGGSLAEFPHQHKRFAHNGRINHQPIPESKYAP